MSEPFLLPHEYRIMTVRRHPVVLARPVAEAAGALGAAIWLTISGSYAGPALITIWLVSSLILLRLSWKLAVWASWYLVVSNLRMIIVGGLVTRQVGQVPLIQIVNMVFHRSAAGQLLGYGTLNLESQAANHPFHEVRYLPQPDALYREVSGLVFRDATLEQPP